MSNDGIPFGLVLSIRLVGEKVKNLEGKKGRFSNPIWSDKNMTDRQAAGMERNDKKGCPSAFFWQTAAGDFCAYWRHRAMVVL
jgi:hypothetical protein